MAGTRYVVEVSGLRQILNALDETDKKASKEIQKRITTAAKSVALEAGYISPGSSPVSSWGTWWSSRDGRDLGFEPTRVARGFKVQRNNFRRRGVSAGAGWDVYQSDAGGNIFEVMGDGSRVTTRSGERLVQTINRRFPAKQPRSLIPAYYRVVTPELKNEIRDAIIREAQRLGLS